MKIGWGIKKRAVGRELDSREPAEEWQARSEALKSFGMWSTVALAFASAANIATGDPAWARGGLWAMWCLAYLGSEWCRRRGRLGWSAACLGVGGWAVGAGIQWFSGGLDSPVAGAQALGILLGGLIGGARLATALGALSMIDCAAMWAAQEWGWHPEPALAQSLSGMFAQQMAIDAVALFGVGASLLRTKRAMGAARMQRERALQAVESFKALFVKSPAPMGLTEAQARPGETSRKTVAVNEAFSRLFKVPAGEEELERAQSSLWRDLAGLIEIRDALGEGGRVERFKARMRTWDGSQPIVCMVSAKPVRWEGVDSVLWTFQDVTENEALREELEGLNAELEARVEGKALELAMARKELERRERLATLGEMVAGVAHEINTPIGNALLAVTSLEEPARKLLGMSEGASLSRSELARAAKRVREATELAEENLGRASEIIKNFKQLSADQAGQTRREFEAGAVASGALRAMGPALKARSVAWSVSSSPEAERARIDGYPGALSQIVTVLASNALVHAFDESDPKPGESRCFDVEVDLDRDQPGWVRLRLRDNGAGLSAPIAAKIFEPFFTTKAGAGGTGLGLAIAWNIAREALGGELRLDPSRDQRQGCCFELRLPMVSPRPARAS